MPLSRIDSKLISFFQWMVRQIELYTKATRRDTINFTLLSLRWLLVIWLAITIPLVYFESFSTLMLIICYGFFKALEEEKRILEKNKIPILLEIEVGWKLRIFSLSQFFFMTFLSMVADSSSLIFHSKVMSMLYFLWTCLYYLKCTSSLPPGEKEKRKTEKEIKGLVPISVR